MICEKWRPLALKGICECGQRFWQHSPAVQEQARRLDCGTRGTQNATATAISANASRRKPFLSFLGGDK